MPVLACARCGRRLDDLAPTDERGGAERRCPRCGAFLDPERRAADRPAGAADRPRGAAGSSPGEPSAEGRPAAG